MAARLGRVPTVDFEVVTRDAEGSPAVIRNAPFDHFGVPMPTLYWLVDPVLCKAVGRLESRGGVREAERSIDAAAVDAAHEAYASERDSGIPDSHVGPRPSGGVGGTARGVKCLHAHYAYLLAGGDDPVGTFVAEHLEADET